MEKENQRVMLTKRLLKDGLLRILSRKGLNNVSVSELCKESGINRATFYRHYEIPRDVLVEIELEILEDLRANVDLRAHGMVDAKTALIEICTYFSEHAELAKILIKNNTDDDFAEMLREFQQMLWKERERIKGIGQNDEESIKLLSVFLGSGMYFMIRQWIMEDIDKTPEEIATLIFGVLNIK